jgi:hypothetical protein
MTVLLDDYEGEADYDSEAEDYEADYDSEGEDYEDARSDALRRQRAARARRLRAARQQMSRDRRVTGTRVARPPATPRQTVQAIRNLDLETKVGEDSLRAAIERANRRATRATYATVAGVAIDQAFDTFEADLAGHEFVRAGLRFAPLLLLSPQRRRPGVEGVVMDPRFIGAAALAGLLAVGELRDRDDDVATINIDDNDIDSSNGTGQVVGVAVNKKGSDTGKEIIWSSPDQAVFQLDRTGRFTIPSPVTQGTTVRVTASAGDVSRTVFIRLVPPTPKTGAVGGPPPAAKAAATAAAKKS